MSHGETARGPPAAARTGALISSNIPAFSGWHHRCSIAGRYRRTTWRAALDQGFPATGTLAANWNPCFGACYTWTASYNMESNYDRVIVNGQSYTGAGSACGIINVKLDTDGSIQSPGARITATCPAPSGPCHTGNTCGAYSSSGACWCDQGCVAYGDCCSDGPC